MFGLESRELWMLVGMVVVAAFFACLNYGLTKVGLDKSLKDVPLYKWKKPVMIGGALGFLTWLSTASGALPHETGLFMAANAGWIGEKGLALYLNNKERNSGPKVPDEKAFRLFRKNNEQK